MSAPGDTAELLTERRGRVLWVTFNRPQVRNAVTWNMYNRLVEACAGADRAHGVHAMVLTGAGGKAFVAGTDIEQFQEFRSVEDAHAYEIRADEVMQALEKVKVPTVAAIAGACTGAGAVIASCCDVRIASESVRFGVPIARTLGNCLSMPNLARLVAVAGSARVADLVMRARLLDAAEMLASAIAAEITTDAGLEARAQAVAEEMATLAPITLAVTREGLRRLRSAPVAGADRDLIEAAYGSRDFREGVAAFVAKRPPSWEGA